MERDMPALENQSSPHVVIIGAGVSGIIAAVVLKKQLGYENFTIYEKSPAEGGTWRDNTYPGCSSDSPIHWYSLSTELNPYWSSFYAPQAEILEYWQKIYRTYRLASYTSFNTIVHAAEWNEEEQRYHLTLEDTKMGKHKTDMAEVVICAYGFFQKPIIPSGIDMPGLEKFRGPSWHSACWRNDVNLSGKRVCVVGNACSGTQVVSSLARDKTIEVYNIARSPQWFLPKPQFHYPGWAKWIFAHIPGALRTYRNYVMAIHDVRFVLFRNIGFISRFLRKTLLEYILTSAKNYPKELLPDFAPGCKRMIIDPEYLHSLNLPNVHLCASKIDEVSEDRIRLANGQEIPVDVIVFATGFGIIDGNTTIRGRNEQTLDQYWNKEGGPTAYLGTCIPGFPNFFMLAGPNVVSAHASVIYTSEVQMQYVAQIISPILEAKARSFTIKNASTIKYNDWLRQQLKKTVWGGCSSWYHRGDKNISMFPGTMAYFWWLLRRPVWSNYLSVGAARWEAELKRTKRMKWLTFTISMLGIGLVMTKPNLGQISTLLHSSLVPPMHAVGL